MRLTTPGAPGEFRARVIAGSRVILIALDLAEQKCQGLMGFAFKREHPGTPGDWL